MSTYRRSKIARISTHSQATKQFLYGGRKATTIKNKGRCPYVKWKHEGKEHIMTRAGKRA